MRIQSTNGFSSQVKSKIDNKKYLISTAKHSSGCWETVIFKVNFLGLSNLFKPLRIKRFDTREDAEKEHSWCEEAVEKFPKVDWKNTSDKNIFFTKEIFSSHCADDEISLLLESIIEYGKLFAKEVIKDKYTEEYRNKPIGEEQYCQDKKIEISICFEFVCCMLHFVSRITSKEEDRKIGDIIHAHMSKSILQLFTDYFSDVSDEDKSTINNTLVKTINETDVQYGCMKLAADISDNDPQTIFYAAALKICKLAGKKDFRLLLNVTLQLTTAISSLEIIEKVDHIKNKMASSLI